MAQKCHTEASRESGKKQVGTQGTGGAKQEGEETEEEGREIETEKQTGWEKGKEKGGGESPERNGCERSRNKKEGGGRGGKRKPSLQEERGKRKEMWDYEAAFIRYQHRDN